MKNKKKLVRKTISIYEYQAAYIEKNAINLSKLVRKLLDNFLNKK